MKKIYRSGAVLIFALFLLALSGCRYRISHEEAEAPPPTVEPPVVMEYASPPPEENAQPMEDGPDEKPEEPEEVFEDEPDEPEDEDKPEPAPVSPETYTATLYYEATVDDFSPLAIEIETEDAHRYGTEPYEAPPEADPFPHATTATTDEYEEAPHAITVEEPDDIEGEVTIGDDGGIIGLITAYSTILRQGVNAIFPCQLRDVYVETTAELTTVARNSEKYQLIIHAGGLNVSTRLSPDNLTVTADWVVRRNPDVIVKFVDETILGQGIYSTHAATVLMASLRERPEWDSLEALQENQMLLISEQVLASEAATLAAKLLISQMLYPELFTGVDVNGAVAGLMAGVDGVYFYF